MILTAFDAIVAGIYVEFYGGGEWNPLSYYLYRNFGFWAVIPTLPLYYMLFYALARAGGWLSMKLEKYPYGERVVLTSIALIWIPIDIELAIMLLSGFTIRPIDFKLLASSALALVAVYIIYTEFRWRKEKKKRTR